MPGSTPFELAKSGEAPRANYHIGAARTTPGERDEGLVRAKVKWIAGREDRRLRARLGLHEPGACG